jgi:hypothetical protein
LKISGQNEIDIYVPVFPKDYDSTVSQMTKFFGNPKSNYPCVRARFPISGYDKHIDVFVINRKDRGWIESEEFTSYLLKNPETLNEYKKLKEEGNGLSTKEYYTRKIV